MRLWKARLAVVVAAVAVIAAGSPGGGVRAADVGAGRGDAPAPVPSPNGAQDRPPHYVEIPISGPRAELQSAIAQGLTSEQNVRLGPLIKQLADDDFRKRESAVDQLKSMGPATLERLTQARDSATDPELANRADSVIRYLTQSPAQARPSVSADSFRNRMVGRRWRGRAADGVNLRVDLIDGAKIVEVNENANGRTIRISDGPDGIDMSIVPAGGGAEREVHARTPEMLKKQDEEAFALYQKWMGRGGPGGVIHWRGGRGQMVLPPPIPARINPIDPNDPAQRAQQQAADFLQRMRREQIDAIRQAQQLQRDVAEMERRAAEAGGAGAGVNGVPGIAPRKPRLGVRILEWPERDAVTVADVLPGERAEKLGLKRMDTIRSINGQKVTDGDSLRQTIAEAKGPMVVEVVRDGETVKLAEKQQAN
jgi:hypothetical protein